MSIGEVEKFVLVLSVSADIFSDKVSFDNSSAVESLFKVLMHSSLNLFNLR